MRKTAFSAAIAIAVIAGATAYGFAYKPEVMNNIIQSQAVYGTVQATTPTTQASAEVAAASTTNTTVESTSLNDAAPAAGQEKTPVPQAAESAEPKAATTETAPAAAPVPAPTEQATTPVPAEPAASDILQAQEALQDHVLGSDKALLTVYDYSSMTCPHCGNFHNEIFPKVKQYYIDTGKVRWVIRAYPHSDAALRAEMLARCVPRDQYIKMRDMMFSSQERWAFSPTPLINLESLVKIAGIDSNKFGECTTNKILEAGVLKIAEEGATKYQIASTPTFIFNDNMKKLAGAGSYEGIAYELDSALEELETKAKAAQQSTPIPAGKL